ncbi:MAG TPA: redoxin domain-containing protein [Gemmatimonadaceae bacterium]|nr:redoxin domain-containing protein [Gemmatimonadaceae bacterium]
MTLRPPAVGEAAPDFTLETTAGTSVTLSHFRGQKHVLIAFFPLAFTGTCTAELCSFTDDYAQFVERGVEVIPISVDMLPSLKAFKAQHHISVELASDLRREVARVYGVLNEEKWTAKRSYFLVDAKGVVRWTHVESVNGQRRENAEILAQVARLAE